MYILSITDIWGFGYIFLLLYCSYTIGTLDAVLITEIHVIYRFTADNVHELVSTALHIYVQIHTVQMKAPKVVGASVHSLSSSTNHRYNAQQINILV